MRFWDPSTGEQVGKPLIGHTGAASAVTFNPAGNLLATAANDRTGHPVDPRREPRPGRDYRQRRRQEGIRKRGLAVDALGLIIAVVVMAASVTDNVIGVRLLDKVVEHTPTVTRAWVDAGFKHELAIHGAVLGIDVEVVKRSDVRAGFAPDREAVGRGADQRHDDAAPPAGTRIRVTPRSG